MPVWQGGDYNGSWGTEHRTLRFSNKSAADEFSKTLKQDHRHDVYVQKEVIFETAREVHSK